MTIVHHLDDATLLSHAAGTLPNALAVVAAAHIGLCADCRSRAALADDIGGALLDGLTPAGLDRAAPPLPADIAPSVMGPARVLPAALSDALDGRLDGIRWRPIGIGLWDHRVPLQGESAGELRLIRVSPGCSVPAHGHNGAELTMVLRGAYSDETGRFATGDVADLDEAVEHQPVADPTTGCICVLASERRARFHGILARLLQPLIGL
jgi:putative transcriptional regulator